MQLHFFSPYGFAAELYPRADSSVSGHIALLDESNRIGDDITLAVALPPEAFGSTGFAVVGNTLADRYLRAIKHELAEVSTFIDRNRTLSKVILTGNAALLSAPQLEELVEAIRSELSVTPSTVVEACCHAEDTTLATVDLLRRLEFTAVTIRVTDFRFDVLEAVGQPAPAVPPAELVAYIRKRGRLDLALALEYGLPMQSYESVVETTTAAAALSPNRMVVRAMNPLRYAPSIVQKMESYGIPTTTETGFMRQDVANTLLAAGYTPLCSELYVLSGSWQPTEAMRENALGLAIGNGPIVGVGAGSPTLVDNALLANAATPEAYIASVQATGFGIPNY